jgi:hypothetical protein
MPEDRLIDPSWLVKARQARKRFAIRVALVFGILSVLAWWALPRLEERKAVFDNARRLIKKESPEAPLPVKILVLSAGVFKVFWAGIAIGCGAAILLAFTGKIDTFVPTLNLVVLLVGAGALALTFYVFYAPALLALEALR